MEMKPLPSIRAELPCTAGPGRPRIVGASGAQCEMRVHAWPRLRLARPPPGLLLIASLGPHAITFFQ